jgi:hypothetical protein
MAKENVARPRSGEDETERHAEEAVEEASPWIERMARFGYAIKGAVYIVVGVLALEVATGIRERATDPPGAFRIIGTQPFGHVMLGFISLGLAGYALWRLFQAVADPEGEGRDASGIASRVGHGAAALGYLGLAFTAGQLMIASGGGSSPKDWTASLLYEPSGWVVVLVVGIGVVGYGLYQLYMAYEADFEEHLKRGRMSSGVEGLIMYGGQFGLAARGVVIGIAGVLLTVAALRLDPNEAGGLDAALQTLLRQPFGPWILGVAAFGLIAYGLLMLAVARYGRISPGRAF